MILIDTSLWIDHLRSGDAVLGNLLDDGQGLTHPFVIGELALGNLRQRDFILKMLQNMPLVISARDDEVLHFLNHNDLFGRGIGYVDAHLLASVQLTPEAWLWTRDKRLHDVANRLSLAADF